jgi:hypothetical protein
MQIQTCPQGVERKFFRILAKIFHRQTSVAVTATYIDPYHETCYAHLNAANRLNLAHT